MFSLRCGIAADGGIEQRPHVDGKICGDGTRQVIGSADRRSSGRRPL